MFFLHSLLFFSSLRANYDKEGMVNEVMRAMEKCNSFMHSAFDCWPPKRKINKYSHRLKAVFFDSIHHLTVGKCDKNSKPGSNRYRRDTVSSTDTSTPTLAPATMTRHSMPDIARMDRPTGGEANSIDRSLFGMGNLDRGVMEGFVDFVEPGLGDDMERGQAFTDRIMGEDRKQFLRLERECQKATKAILDSRLLSKCTKLKKWRDRLDHLLFDITKMKKVCLKKNTKKNSKPY